MSRPPNRPRPPHEFAEQLQTQLNFLERSAGLFDDGFHDEALRLASTIRLLLHTTKMQTPLVSRLQLDGTSFVDTTIEQEVRSDQSAARLAGLVVSSDGSSQRYVAMLDSFYVPGRSIPLGEWWNALVLAYPPNGVLSRKDLVLAVAEQDGGAHVDAGIEERYARVSRDNALGFNPAGLPNGVDGSAALVSIRQIAHEVPARVKVVVA